MVKPRIENTCEVSLRENEMRLSATNGGIPIDLPPNTTRVIFHLIPEPPAPLPTPVPIPETKIEEPPAEKTEEPVNASAQTSGKA